jgi:hypothetical protein
MSLRREVDRAIAAENRRYLADPDAQARNREVAARWARGIETGLTSGCRHCGAFVGNACTGEPHEREPLRGLADLQALKERDDA